MLIYKTNPKATFIKASAQAIGYDLTCTEVEQDETTSFPRTFLKLGVIVQPDDGQFFMVIPRSSFPKSGWFVANSLGLIDPDYRGEWKMQVAPIAQRPRTDLQQLIGQRVAQAVILSITQPKDFIEVASLDRLSKTERGSGGFGSTGI